MMDIREKLVELLKKADKEALSAAEMGKPYNETEVMGRMADNLIASGVTVQEWISVTERLPENGVHVLLCCEVHICGGKVAGKYVCDGYYAEANKIIAGDFPEECNCEYSEEDDEYYLCEGWYEVIKNWDDYNSVAVEDFVTHWMPLPQPPKDEELLEALDYELGCPATGNCEKMNRDCYACWLDWLRQPSEVEE